MATYTQANRPVRVESALGEDVLLLHAFSGEEAVSSPFEFVVDLVSEDPAISPDDVLRGPLAIRIDMLGGEERIIHGLVRRFEQLGQEDGLTSYRAEVVPWLWFLSLSSDSRIFQNLSVPEIVERVFEQQGYSDFDIRCVRSYPPREYCVQYGESHLDFVSRLLEDEGIFYFFEHEGDKHTLVLADDTGSIRPCPGQPRARMAVQADRWQGEDVITSLVQDYRVHPGVITLRDYDFLKPSLDLESSLSGDEKEECYEYPGNYCDPEEGERYARLLLEGREASRCRVRGTGSCRGLRPGFRFELKEHYRDDANQMYHVLRVGHSGRVGDYRSGDRGSFDYQNEFVAMPYSAPYRPPRRTPRPRIPGTQTALVVGKPGEEIWTDKYGRIKVQFYWDREGRKDENSSCWVRVAQAWAGKNWGSVAIPRIGQEVVVEFLEGDPDRPLVVGSLYNANVMPPYELPGSGMVSGLKSNSTPGGGGYNEVSMNDTKGEEAITIHGQYDMNTTVENDQTLTVHNNRTTTVDVDDTESVGSNQQLSVGADRTASVGANENLTVGADRTVGVDANEKLTVGADRTTEIGSNDATTVGINSTLEAGTNVQVSAGDKIVAGAGTEVEISAGAKISISAGAEISISVGPSSIKLTPTGVEISAPKITSAAQALNEITGATIKLN